MRSPDSRLVLAASLLAALALTACSSSGGNTPSPSPSNSSTTSVAPRRTNLAGKLPLLVPRVTAKQFTTLNKVVPLLPGVQNTSWDPKTKTLEVFLHSDVTTAERAVVVSQLRKYTGKTAVADTEQGSTGAPTKSVPGSPTSVKTS